ncbi:MAG TPA: hypothetical protein VNL36_00430 [Bacteroidota bacterium]|nr:hypothetical protein [Bacteroidota bacterium]
MRPLLIVLIMLGSSSRLESQTDSVATQGTWEITADVGRTLLNLGHDWKQKYIVRLGFGKEFEGFGRWDLILEYQNYRRNIRWGENFPSFFDEEYPQHVLGIYASYTVGEWFRLSLGGLKSFHGEMYYRQTVSPSDTAKRVIPATTETWFNALIGMKTEIHLGRGFSIPLAVDFFILPLFYLDEPIDLLLLLFTATPRIGISKRF